MPLTYWSVDNQSFSIRCLKFTRRDHAIAICVHPRKVNLGRSRRSLPGCPKKVGSAKGGLGTIRIIVEIIGPVGPGLLWQNIFCHKNPDSCSGIISFYHQNPHYFSRVILFCYKNPDYRGTIISPPEKILTLPVEWNYSTIGVQILAAEQHYSASRIQILVAG